MKQYLELLDYILQHGEDRGDRTGTGVISSFGHQIRFNLEDGFPAVTTKSLAWKGVVSELLWFLEGSDDERRLAEIRFKKDRSELTDLSKFSTIWTDNADNQGVELGYENTETTKKLGPVYGVQWRDWGGVDQIKKLINDLQSNPNGRRHILSAWNVEKIDSMALPPCHVMSQFYISKSGRLSCQMYQRSADMFLGVPFNIASYALLQSILANILNLTPGEFVHTFGDAHIYKNSIDQVKEQLSREPKKLPKLVMPNIDSIDSLNNFSVDDFVLDGYESHPALKAPMAQEIDMAIPVLEKAAKMSKDGDTYILLGNLYLFEDRMKDSIRAIEAGLKKPKVKSRSQALLVLGQAHFELQNFEEAKKHFRAAARDENKRIKKTANSWIKYAENEEIRVKNLALRRDFIQQSKAKAKS